jgi:RimJ/RimL family protein N-acetyltransferase
MRDTPTLADDLVVLRPWRAEDGEWYAETVRDPLIQRFTIERPNLTGGQVRDAIAVLATNPDQVGWVICGADTGERWGNLALSRRGGTGHVSYWIAPAARGCGAATAALRLLVDWASDSPYVRELVLWTHEENTASQAVAERAGFRRTPERDGSRRTPERDGSRRTPERDGGRDAGGRDWPAIWYVHPLSP